MEPSSLPQAKTKSKTSTSGQRPRSTAVAEREGKSFGLSGRVLDGLTEGVVVVDEHGLVQGINRAACVLLGAEEEKTLGKSASEVVASVVPGEDLFAAALAGERTESETLIATSSGAEVPVRVAVVPRGPGGGAVAILNDLTTAKRLEQELRRRERLALMGQLLAGVAHEVRNPLAGISSSAQVLLGRFEPRDERTRFVRAILNEVNRLDRIVTRLLQFARPGEPRLRRSRLGDVVHQVAETSADWLKSASVELEIKIASDLPECWFDSDLIHQVILNLVHNAVQAMPNGGSMKIEVRAIQRKTPASGRGRRGSDLAQSGRRREPMERSFVQVKVTDEGEGIAADVVPQLFDPFFTTKASGTGLGLSICQSIVQEHGGTIQLASQVGQGTTVIFELPVEKRRGERRSE